MIEAVKFETSRPYNYVYYWTGLMLLFVNKIRHSVKGYTNPRTFPITDFRHAIEYDFKVFDHWLKVLEAYLGKKISLEGKTILELGPGTDLGIGILCLMNGAKEYNAIDVNNLVQTVPARFYEELFEYIERNFEDKAVDTDYLRSEVLSTQNGKNGKINYVCDKDFDLSTFKERKIDLVFSQAAFEHFENLDKTISQLNEIAKSGTILIAEVDLRTHTRWIRDLDPLNIYRYGDSVYDLFRSCGSPNRLRPFEYEEILEKHGWSEITIVPLTELEQKYLAKVSGSLSQKFCGPVNQMEYLSIMICARKS